MKLKRIIIHIRRWNTYKKVIVGTIAFLLVWYIGCLPGQLFDVTYSTVVTDRNGELLGARIADDGQWRFPPSGKVPAKVATCLIEFEDRSFNYHCGVNPLAVGRALWQNMRAGKVVSGGSTLTMQTIRLSRNRPRKLGEKIIEAILATRLELSYSKQEILALYAAHAPFGGNVVGLDAASWRYFGHPSAELSWAEAATLAVLPNSPSVIHMSRSRGQLKKKRDRLLKHLHDKSILDLSAYELALSEPLPGEPMSLPQIAPHLVTRLHTACPGMQLQSSVDIDVQKRIEGILERWNGEFTRGDIRNLAAMVIDIPTKKVLAYCGNVGFQEGHSGNQVDIIRSPRSTGSILKPFLYYAMLNEGEILPHTLLPDIPLNINGFAPQNFNLQFEGAVPASEAIARSLNIPTVHMLRKYSVPKFYDMLKQAGLTTLTKPASHYGLSLILGGAEGTLGEITAAYADMARCLEGLENIPLSFIHQEKVEAKPGLYQAGAVWQTFQAIKEVNRPEEIDWRVIPSMQTIAWKTGTSYGFRDAWAVGVTPRYAVGVWVGNAAGDGKPGLVGARTAGPVMFDIFNALPSSGWFDEPSAEFTEAEICRKSGHIRGRFCEESDTLLILPNGLRTDACPYHHQVYLTADGKNRVYENCANRELTVQKSWFTLPPAWEWYYKQHHPEYTTLPPLKPGCGEDAMLPMQFIYPQMNARVYLPKQLDGSDGPITFELVHSDRNAVVFWHLDNTYLQETRDFHKLSVIPTDGKHSMTAVDQEGNRLSVTFYVNSR